MSVLKGMFLCCFLSTFYLPLHEVLGHMSDSASIPTHLFPNSQSRYRSRVPSKQYTCSVHVDQRDHFIHSPTVVSSAALHFSMNAFDVNTNVRTRHNI